MLLLGLTLDRLTDGTRDNASENPLRVTCKDVQIAPDPDGRFDRCATFDGARSMITVEGITCPDTFTFMVWVKKSPDVSFYYATILAFGEDAPYFGLSRGRVVLANSLLLPDELDTSWNHVAVTQDQVDSRIYVNGCLMGVSSSRANAGGTGLRIGCDMTRGKSLFCGALARLMIFDEALSQVVIAEAVREPRSWTQQPAEPAEVVSVAAKDALLVSYAAYVPFLRRLYARFPAFALSDVIEALDAGAHPSSVAIARGRGYAQGGFWCFALSLEALALGADDVRMVELDGVTLYIELAPPGLDALGDVIARLEGRLALFGGRFSAVIHAEVRQDEGVRITVTGPLFGSEVETRIHVHSWRRCELAARPRFSHPIRVHGREVRLELTALIVVTIDGSAFHQQIDYLVELAGEEIRASAPYARPIMSLDDLVVALESTALPELTVRVSEVLDRLDAELPSPDAASGGEGAPAEPEGDAWTAVVVDAPPLYHAHIPALCKLHERFPTSSLGHVIEALRAGAHPSTLPARWRGAAQGDSYRLALDVEPFALRVGEISLVELCGADAGDPLTLFVDLARPDLDAAGKVRARLGGRINVLSGAISAEINEPVLPDGGLLLTLVGGSFGEDVETRLNVSSWACCELSLRPRFHHAVRVRDRAIRVPLAASISAVLDGTSFRQEISYYFDLAGEEVCVVAPWHRPIVSPEDLLGVFKDTALFEIERSVSEAIFRRGADVLAWLRHKLVQAVDDEMHDVAARLFRR